MAHACRRTKKGPDKCMEFVLRFIFTYLKPSMESDCPKLEKANIIIQFFFLFPGVFESESKLLSTMASCCGFLHRLKGGKKPCNKYQQRRMYERGKQAKFEASAD